MPGMWKSHDQCKGGIYETQSNMDLRLLRVMWAESEVVMIGEQIDEVVKGKNEKTGT